MTEISKLMQAFGATEPPNGMTHQEWREARNREWQETIAKVSAETAATRHRSEAIARGVPAKDVGKILAELSAPGSLEKRRPLVLAAKLLTYEPDKRRTLVLSGPTGAGKTVAAGWLVAKLEGRMVTAHQISRMDKFSAEAMGPLEAASCLAIDDLGVEYLDPKGVYLSALDGLLNARYAALLRTVITTNLDGASFKKRYGARIYRRCAQEAASFQELGGK